MAKLFESSLPGVLDALLCHFAQRREALDVIGRFGNRFEHWVKWEAAIALHCLSYAEGAEGIQSIAVEREDCDLFIGRKVWPESGYPEPSPKDLWIELKARNTADKGAAELASWLIADIEKQRQRSEEKEGHFLVVALVVAHPTKPLAESWIDNLVEHVSENAEVRRLYLDQRTASNDDDLLAALVGWSA